MIKYDNKNWFTFIFKIKSTIYRGMLFSMFIMGLITFILCWLHLNYGWFKFPFNTPALGAISLVVGMLLVFRMNTAYDRWWEGRKLLGQLMNTSRFLSMKVDNYVQDKTLRIELEKLIISYPYALAEHLQDNTHYTCTHESLPETLRQNLLDAKHKPSYILNLISSKCLALNKSGEISNEQLLTLENCISSLTDVVGACERIKFTPIPFAYAIHLKRIILLYCLLLPFTLIGDYGYWSILMFMVIFFVMV
ncbi:MAG TPA: bestrophin family protein, partial [Cytophagales bacterium]|nr:bestrophin family protein [Cytophagales bacterium]